MKATQIIVAIISGIGCVLSILCAAIGIFMRGMLHTGISPSISEICYEMTPFTLFFAYMTYFSISKKFRRIPAIFFMMINVWMIIELIVGGGFEADTFHNPLFWMLLIFWGSLLFYWIRTISNRKT